MTVIHVRMSALDPKLPSESGIGSWALMYKPGARGLDFPEYVKRQDKPPEKFALNLVKV